MAFVLSSVSGNLISAASAGYAPTNSADVSAIASAYQVVSSTATQLYAGTAYVTSVNDTPLSASRAGNAANASLATSAWYDGTGRLISSLPDSATVSAIASAYTTSKQDTLAFAYNTANQISSINGSALGGMDEAAVSGIASAYAESAASSKLDTSAFNSSDFYSTANPSGFITGVDLSPYQTTADMSSYIPTSMSSDFQQVTGMSSYALSSDVSATVDLVGTQSANWGGSALQLSAGPGITFTKSGDTLLVEAVAPVSSVLWESSNQTANNYSITLSESIYNFKRVAIYGSGHRDQNAFACSLREFEVPEPGEPIVASVFALDGWNTAQTFALANGTNMNLSGTSGFVGDSWYFGMTTGATPTFAAMRRLNDPSDIRPYKIVGIDKTAGV